MRKWFTTFLVFAAITVCATFAHADGRVGLAWNPNSESDIGGYKLHYGTTSRVYDKIIDVGNKTEVEIGELIEGETYYFTLTAYDTVKNESGYSIEISHEVPRVPPVTPEGFIFTVIVEVRFN